MHAELSESQRVVAIGLKIGELRDAVDEWMQRYFDYLSRGTIAEGAVLKIEHVPVVARCENCGQTFGVDWKTQEIACPQCQGTKAALITGRELSVEDIEVI